MRSSSCSVIGCDPLRRLGQRHCRWSFTQLRRRTAAGFDLPCSHPRGEVSEEVVAVRRVDATDTREFPSMGLRQLQLAVEQMLKRRNITAGCCALNLRELCLARGGGLISMHNFRTNWSRNISPRNARDISPRNANNNAINPFVFAALQLVALSCESGH